LAPTFLSAESANRSPNPYFIGKPTGPPPRKSEIVAANAGKWRQAMTPAQKILFESAAGDLLRELGYETDGRVREIAPPEPCLWRAHHRFFWVCRRLNRRGYYREVLEALVKHGAIIAHRVRIKIGGVSKAR